MTTVDEAKYEFLAQELGRLSATNAKQIAELKVQHLVEIQALQEQLKVAQEQLAELDAIKQRLSELTAEPDSELAEDDVSEGERGDTE